MAATRKFTADEKFGFRLEHLDYQNTITPQGNFLVRREVRRFRAYFLDIPLFDKNVITSAACPRSDLAGGGYCADATHPHGIQGFGQNDFCNQG